VIYAVLNSAAKVAKKTEKKKLYFSLVFLIKSVMYSFSVEYFFAKKIP
jgi:hypothetical protein